MLDILTLLFRFTMRSRMLFNPFAPVVRMSISQERPASPNFTPLHLLEVLVYETPRAKNLKTFVP